MLSLPASASDIHRSGLNISTANDTRISPKCFLEILIGKAEVFRQGHVFRRICRGPAPDTGEESDS